MFRTRISFSFHRLFCLRIRCSAKENTSSGTTRPSKSSRHVSLRRVAIHNRHALPPTHLRPVSTHSRINPTPTPTPIIIISAGQDTTQAVFPLPPIPALPEEIGPQILTDGASLGEGSPVNASHVSFEDHPACADGISITDPGELDAQPAEVGAESGMPTPPEIIIISAPTHAPDSDPITGPVPHSVLVVPTEVQKGSCFESAEAHRSLLVPQPVRANTVRFSLPARSTVPRATIKNEHTRKSVRQNKYASLLPIGPAASTVWTAERNPRQSRKISKQEAREVLGALAVL